MKLKKDVRFEVRILHFEDGIVSKPDKSDHWVLATYHENNIITALAQLERACYKAAGWANGDYNVVLVGIDDEGEEELKGYYVHYKNVMSIEDKTFSEMYKTENLGHREKY